LFLAACALSGALVTGCSKNSSSSEQSTGTSTEATAVASEAPPAAGAAPAAATAAPAATHVGAMTSGSATAAASLGDASHGQQIFNQNCSSCHGQDGVGGGIGPALKEEKSRKDFKAAVAWIEDPKPPMPKLYPQPLGEKDVDDVAAYVETL
jgi:mono/diheme cytochrome c family protein